MDSKTIDQIEMLKQVTQQCSASRASYQQEHNEALFALTSEFSAMNTRLSSIFEQQRAHKKELLDSIKELVENFEKIQANSFEKIVLQISTNSEREKVAYYQRIGIFSGVQLLVLMHNDALAFLVIVFALGYIDMDLVQKIALGWSGTVGAALIWIFKNRFEKQKKISE